MLESIKKAESKPLDLVGIDRQPDRAQKAIQVLDDWCPRKKLVSNTIETANQIQVVDLFSGCGGMSLGFDAYAQAFGGFRLVGGIDINQTSCRTYEKNLGVHGHRIDLRELVESESIRENFFEIFTELNEDQPLVLIGCAPCQGFSAHRKKNWNERDKRNDLISVFAEIVTAVQPDCVIMENVPELLSHRYWEYFMRFSDRLSNSSYIVKQTIHNAAEFGVPQERFRSIVVAMKEEKFTLPIGGVSPDHFHTVRDAISDLPLIEAGKICKSDPFHKSAKHRNSTLETIRSVPKNGGSRPKGVGPECLDRVNGFYDVYGRLSWDKPAITITHYARNPASGRFTHPEQDRGLTMREAARLQSFPDQFCFTGAFDDVFRQIGEAVPPLLSFAIANMTHLNMTGKGKSENPNVITAPVNDSYAGVIAGIKNRK